MNPTSDVTQPLSVSHGARLEADPSRLLSLAATLRAAAQMYPSHGIRYLQADGSSEFQSYPALLEAASRMLRGLRTAGLKAGDKVLFQLERNEDFVPAFWACTMGGFVPVPISIPPNYDEPHNTLSKLQNAWTMLRNPAVLAGGDSVAGLQRWSARIHLEGLRVIDVGSLRAHEVDEAWHAHGPDDLAVLLLTSGSTGQPKGVQLSHGNILARSAATSQMNQFGPSDVSLNWMPLDHVGGLVMFHIRDVYNACHQIQAPTHLVLANPLVWLDWVSTFRVSITWAPNFAFGLVNEQSAALADGKWDLSCLRFILNGGEAIVSKTARRFVSLLAPFGLPGTSMHPAWGMSETSSGVTYSDQFTLATTSDSDPFVEVGGPVPGISIRIVDQQGSPVPEGKIGSLHVTGLSVTRGYYENPQLNAEVFAKDGWFITGDLGIMRQGRLTITGREKDVIIVNGVNFHSHELESLVEEVKGVEVSFTAAVPVRLAGENTDRIAIFFVPQGGRTPDVAALIREIRSAVVKGEAVNPDYVLPVTKEQIPKTAIGKIQRTQLKQRFERGEFQDLVQSYSAGADPLAQLDWFYRPCWKEVALVAQPASVRHIWILGHDHPACASLVAKLQAQGNRCTVIRSDRESSVDPKSGYVVRPHETHDFKAVLTATGVPDAVVHLWTLLAPGQTPQSASELEQRQQLGIHSLLAFVQAIVDANTAEKSLRILVGSARARLVGDKGPVAFYDAPILGLVRTIPQEIAWVECHHADLDGYSEEAAEQLAAELSAWPKENESAWRGGRRFEPMLERAPASQPPAPLPFTKGGFYVLSGGLGGIGMQFAAHLLQHFEAHVLVLGRTPLPPASRWADVAKQGGAVAERIKACEALALLGGRVHYSATDITNEAAVREAIESTERKWNVRLSGVLHLAGIYHEALLQNETIEGLSRVMAPKMLGAWALHAVARERPGCFFINFSSLISHFGSLSTGAYAAANNFLDAFSDYQRVDAGVRAFNLLWSSWTGVGMSRGYDAGEALHSRGYLRINGDQGTASLLYALRNNHPQLLIGLDGKNRGLQRYFERSADRPNEVAASASNYVAPRNDIELEMSRIWQEILGVPKVGIRDNFFELGGRSLLAAKMFAQINKKLGKNLPIPALFKAPTIEQLAVVFLEQSKSNAVKIHVLSAEGSKTPIFVVPEAGEDLAVAQVSLKPFFGTHPCVALRATAFDLVPPKPVDVTSIAKSFAAEIAAFQSKGPVILGGRGFGNVLAWATADELTRLANGPRVHHFVVWTPPAPAFFEGNGGPSYRFITPSGTGGGMFSRLFKKSATAAEGEISKETRQLRARYGDAALPPGSWPVLLVAPETSSIPWRPLAGSHPARHQPGELDRNLFAS